MRESYNISQRWVMPLAIIVLIVPIVLIEYQVIGYTKGSFGYPMDDVFIHMSIGKNLAQHGVWGTSAFGFASASSSILYPIMLAAVYVITGPQLLAPFLINLFSAIVLLFAIQRWAKREGLSPIQQLLILIATNLIIPLPIIVIIGMEHTTQILLCFLLIYGIAQWMQANIIADKKRWILPWWLIVYGVLVTAIRYESIFLVFVICLMLLYYRQWLEAAKLGLAALLPILVFGVYSLNKGSFFVPNPVLLKSNPIPMSVDGLYTFFTDSIFQKLYYDHSDKSAVVMRQLLILFPLLYLIYSQRVVLKPSYRYILICLAGTTILHMVFANSGWFFRYESYLLGAAVPIVGLLLAKYTYGMIRVMNIPSQFITIIFSLLLLIPFVLRSNEAFNITEHVCENLYQQDYLAGKFLQKYYDSTTVIVNDLGAMSYYPSSKNVDFWGLGNIAVAKAKRGNYYDTPFLDSLTRAEKAKIAVLPSERFDGVAASWHKVATWYMPANMILGAPQLCFYAIDTSMGPQLQADLRAFERVLPPEVTVRYNKQYNQ